MAFYTYVLESEKTGRIFIDQTTDLEKELTRHNSGQDLSTKAHKPWRLLFHIAFDDRSDSMNLAKELKEMDGPKAVKEWVESQE